MVRNYYFEVLGDEARSVQEKYFLQGTKFEMAA
jgi:hypothetical protein